MTDILGNIPTLNYLSDLKTNRLTHFLLCFSLAMIFPFHGCLLFDLTLAERWRCGCKGGDVEFLSRNCDIVRFGKTRNKWVYSICHSRCHPRVSRLFLRICRQSIRVLFALYHRRVFSSSSATIYVAIPETNELGPFP